MSISRNGIKANAHIRLKQETDLLSKNIQLKIGGQPHDEVLLTKGCRFQQYKAIEDRIILQHGLLFWKYYRETGSVKCYQFVITKQVVEEVLCSLYEDFENTP